MPTRSLTQALPGELLITIMSHVLNTFVAEHDTLSYSQQLQYLAGIDKRLRLALFVCMSHNFLGIPASQPRFACKTALLAWPWLATSREREDFPYWTHANGQDWGDRVPMAMTLSWLRNLPTLGLRRIAIDLRLDTFDSSPQDYLNGRNIFGREASFRQAREWVLSTTILNHVAQVRLPALDSIYIRLSPQQEQIDITFDFIRNQPHLRELVVEIDSLMDHPPWGRPRLDLCKLTTSGKRYTPLEVLVIRGPGCQLLGHDDPSLLARIHQAGEVRLSALWTTFHNEPWEDLLCFLRAIPKAEHVEFGVICKQDRSLLLSPPPIPSLDPVICPRLVDLTIQLPQIDARLLRLIQAPHLRALRVRCQGEFDAHGQVADNHFPLLNYFRSACDTSVDERAKVIGLVGGILVSTGSSAFGPGDHGDFTVIIEPDVAEWVPSPPASPLRAGRVKGTTPRMDRPLRTWLNARRTTSALYLKPEAVSRREALIKRLRKSPEASPMRAYIEARAEELESKTNLLQEWLDSEFDDTMSNAAGPYEHMGSPQAGPSRRRAAPNLTSVVSKRVRRDAL